MTPPEWTPADGPTLHEINERLTRFELYDDPDAYRWPMGALRAALAAHALYAERETLRAQIDRLQDTMDDWGLIYDKGDQ